MSVCCRTICLLRHLPHPKSILFPLVLLYSLRSPFNSVSSVDRGGKEETCYQLIRFLYQEQPIWLPNTDPCNLWIVGRLVIVTPVTNCISPCLCLGISAVGSCLSRKNHDWNVLLFWHEIAIRSSGKTSEEWINLLGPILLRCFQLWVTFQNLQLSEC